MIKRSLIGLILTGGLISSTLVGCSSNTETQNQGANTEAKAAESEVTLTLVSYAVTQSAYEKIIPQFVEQWKAETGQDVIIEQSYGGSGSQTRSVIDGLEADVVALALALDTKKIEEAGLIEPGWEQELPNESIVTKSVAAVVKRDDTVKVNQWSDLAQPGIEVITANPKTSGGARWNFLALWGAGLKDNQATEAEAYTENVYSNVPIMPKDAREASDVFYQQQQGNVLINYENEVLLAQDKGTPYPYFVPTDYNISIDSPIALVDANVDKKGTRKVAQAFAEFLYTPAAQKEFAEAGFRPVDQSVAQEYASKFPEVKKLYTVKDFGGWDKIQSQFFDDGAVFDKMLAKTSQK
jgi:sulfate/thiosulfate transport system substrate-binding protein